MFDSNGTMSGITLKSNLKKIMGDDFRKEGFLDSDLVLHPISDSELAVWARNKLTKTLVYDFRVMKEKDITLAKEKASARDDILFINVKREPPIPEERDFLPERKGEIIGGSPSMFGGGFESEPKWTRDEHDMAQKQAEIAAENMTLKLKSDAAAYAQRIAELESINGINLAHSR